MVDIQTAGEVEHVARERLKRTHDKIVTSIGHIEKGNPLASETDPVRLVSVIQRKSGVGVQQAEMIAAAIEMASRPSTVSRARRPGPGRRAAVPTGTKMPGPEAVRGTFDFVGVNFLERGRRAADAVGRVAFLNDSPQGTGFLVGPRLFLTNHHVIESAEAASEFNVQFDYEYDVIDRARSFTSFFFDPDYCFVTDGIEGLDFTLIGIGERRAGNRPLESLGFLPLSDASDKHALGEVANVIQHPDGRYKEVVLRENHLVARDDTSQVLHYVADTQGGSSGSPVFNNAWEAIALHHWGGPWLEVLGTGGHPLATEVNEGIRISAIVNHLKRGTFGGANDRAVETAFAAWEKQGRAPAPTTARTEELIHNGQPQMNGGDGMDKPNAAMRANADGSVTWTVPIEISVRAPLLGAPAAVAPPPVVETSAQADGRMTLGEAVAKWKTIDFSDRAGYEPGFIPGFIVPMPDTSGLSHALAENAEAAEGDDPNELRYHHFSIKVNADRRLATFTAVNIDGRLIRAVRRTDKKVTMEPTLEDLDLERISTNGAEASDAFRPDHRIPLDQQMTKEFYEDQIVAGFLDKQSGARTARIFQKGHLILRGDPAWGTRDQAVDAEFDTFFYTNAAPQVGFFNQGSPLNKPGSKGKLRWRAVETYVLRNAFTMKERISVFAGPIFDDTDPRYRFDSQVPMRFFKLAVWSDGDALRSIALLADQRPVLKIMPEAIGRPEAFGDEDELSRITEFRSTVEEIESLTGLDFGDQVRAGDILAGESAGEAAIDLDAAVLSEPGRRRPRLPRRTKIAGTKGAATSKRPAAKRTAKRPATSNRSRSRR